MKQLSSKEEKYITIYKECLKLINEKDLRFVTHSTLSRRTKISRAWIYKYLGIKKENIIRGACKHFGNMFAEISLQPKKISNAQDMIDDLHHGSRNNLEFALNHPYIVPLYIRFAGTQNIFGQTVKEIETRYKERLIDKFDQIINDREKSTNLAHIVKSLRIGAALEYSILSPEYVTEETKEESLRTLNSLLTDMVLKYAK